MKKILTILLVLFFVFSFSLDAFATDRFGDDLYGQEVDCDAYHYTHDLLNGYSYGTCEFDSGRDVIYRPNKIPGLKINIELDDDDVSEDKEYSAYAYSFNNPDEANGFWDLTFHFDSYSGNAVYKYFLLQQLGKQLQTNVLNLDVIRPTGVKNLNAVADDKRINLFWSPATDNVGIKNYLITYDSKSIDLSQYNPVTSVPNVSYCEKTSCYIDGLENGIVYHFYVLAFDAAGNYSEYWSNEAIAKPLDKKPPTQVEITQKKIVNQTLYLNWNSSSDNEGDVVYKVYWSRDKNKMLPNITSGAKSKIVKGTSTTIKKLAKGKTYYVGVFAIDKSGNESKEAYIYTVKAISSPAAQELQTNVFK